MTRGEFLQRLSDGLRGLPPAQIEEWIADYDAHFAEGMAAGRNDEEIAAALGEPSRLARELRAEAGIRRWEQRRTPSNYARAFFALLGIAIFDLIILLPVLIVVASVVFAFGAPLLGILIAGFTLLAIFGDISTAGNTFAQILAGLGLVSGAIGFGALLLLLLEAVLKWLVRVARLHYRILKPETSPA